MGFCTHPQCFQGGLYLGTLGGSDWSLADRPIDTGLPMGRYCDLASFDGRRCGERDLGILILMKWFRTQKLPFLLMLAIQNLDPVNFLLMHTLIITAHLARYFLW